MFNVKVGEFNVQFTFQHLTGLAVEIGEYSSMPVQAVTNCTLRINGQEFCGMAVCSAYDVFLREKGRKISLARALAEARAKIDVPHDVRECIWLRYFDRGIPNKEWRIEDAVYSRGVAIGILDPQYQPVRKTT